MRQSRHAAWMFLIGWMLILSMACNLSGGNPGAIPSAEATITASALTATHQLSDTPPATGSPSRLPTMISTPTFSPEVATEQPLHSDTPQPSPTYTSTATLTLTLTPTSFPTPEVLPTTSLNLEYSDDFSGGGWPEGGSEDRYSYGYVRGAYRMTVRQPFIEIWSIRQQNYADLRLEIDVPIGSAPIDGYYGFLCRWTDNRNHYRFTTNGRGNFKITRISQGEATDLVSVDDPSLATQAGNFRFSAECNHTQFVLTVNGVSIMSASDETLSTGYYGLLAGTRGERGVDVVFDNFSLYAP